MFLTSEAGNFLIIAIVAVFVIAFALVIYLLITTKKKSPKTNNYNNVQPNRDLEIPEEPNEVLENNQDLSNVAESIEQQVPFNLIEEAEKRIEDNPVVEENDIKNDLNNEASMPVETENKEETNIESVLNQMQKDLDSLEKNETEIARYEEEEEKNAIISYKELMKYKDMQDKDIVLEEKNKDEIKEIIESNPNTVKKFKRSEFISPIFGYNDDSNVTYREIKRPPRKEKIKDSKLEWESDRILKDLEENNAEVMEFEEKEDNVDDNTTRFLDELVDFRKKLD